MPDTPSKPLVIVCWICRILVAAVFVMAAWPKLSGDAGSVAMFEFLGAPWARYAIGIGEVTAAGLLLAPKTALYGGMLSSALMVGAVGAHLTKLGVSLDPARIAGDNIAALDSLPEGPMMFIMAVGALILSLAVVVIQVVLRGRARAAG